MNFDFHPPKQSLTRRNRRTRRHGSRLTFWFLLGLTLLLATPLLIRQTGTDTEAHVAQEEPSAAVEPPVVEIRREIVEGVISSGETMTSLLGEYFTPQDIHTLSQKAKPIFPLTRLCAGQPYKICLADGRFERFEYDIDQDEQLIIAHDGEAFDIAKEPIPYTVTVDQIGGRIETSLFEAVAEIGESDALAINLADIFAWDIDFILDIRSGDSFKALVEKRYREGVPAGYGRILVAEFTNRGKTFHAIRYADGEQRADFYDADGNSVRKAFLKAPLAFSRISSGFTMRRFHPITKTWKAHPAIDYAAPRGTPIKSVGDGTIIKKGYTRGNGNYVKIRHNSTYETLYLHMSKFGRGIHKGSRVAQGQTIGYVGSTGLATGPHLCFRMYKNGSPVNPQRVKAPAARPVSPENMADFRTTAATLLARLNDQPVQLAGELRKETGPARN